MRPLDQCEETISTGLALVALAICATANCRRMITEADVALRAAGRLDFSALLRLNQSGCCCPDEFNQVYDPAVLNAWAHPFGYQRLR